MDHIYHLASPASPKYYMYNPVKTIKTNTIGTLNVLGELGWSTCAVISLHQVRSVLLSPLLGLAKRTKARILFTSTSEVYGG